MSEKVSETLSVIRRISSSAFRQQFNRKTGTARSSLIVSVFVIAVLLAACSSAAPLATTAPQQPAASSTPVPTATAIPTATAAAISVPQGTAKPTSLDPCQLITSQEASLLAGASFGPGKEETTSGGGKICTYGANTTNVFMVDVAQAADKATAEKNKEQFLADLQANLAQLTSEGLNVNQLPNFADGAVTANVSLSIEGETINGNAFGFLKGTIFVGFNDLVRGAAAPSNAAMQAEAQTVLGKLP